MITSRNLAIIRRALRSRPRRGRNLPTLPAAWFLRVMPPGGLASVLQSADFQLLPTTRPYQRKAGDIRVRLTWVQRGGGVTTSMCCEILVLPSTMLTLLP